MLDEFLTFHHLGLGLKDEARAISFLKAILGILYTYIIEQNSYPKI